jgi:hypothetical protein
MEPVKCCDCEANLEGLRQTVSGTSREIVCQFRRASTININYLLERSVTTLLWNMILSIGHKFPPNQSVKLTCVIYPMRST